MQAGSIVFVTIFAAAIGGILFKATESDWTDTSFQCGKVVEWTNYVTSNCAKLGFEKLP